MKTIILGELNELDEKFNNVIIDNPKDLLLLTPESNVRGKPTQYIFKDVHTFPKWAVKQIENFVTESNQHCIVQTEDLKVLSFDFRKMCKVTKNKEIEIETVTMKMSKIFTSEDRNEAMKVLSDISISFFLKVISHNLSRMRKDINLNDLIKIDELLYKTRPDYLITSLCLRLDPEDYPPALVFGQPNPVIESLSKKIPEHPDLLKIFCKDKEFSKKLVNEFKLTKEEKKWLGIDSIDKSKQRKNTEEHVRSNKKISEW